MTPDMIPALLALALLGGCLAADLLAIVAARGGQEVGW